MRKAKKNIAVKTSVSSSGRFVVVDGLHIDRTVFERLATWAEPKGLSVQDAIQIAVCWFNDTYDGTYEEHVEN